MRLLRKHTLLLAGLMGAVLTLPLSARAEQPAARVGLDHYRGTWLEIARRPMWITDGCIAGYTTYKPAMGRGAVAVEDGCRQGSTTGTLRTIRGDGRITDLGSTNAELYVKYPLFITFTYKVLYKSPDKSWFISADPAMKNLWIYARSAPSKSKLALMVRKAASLGYDVKQLEFPETAAPSRR